MADFTHPTKHSSTFTHRARSGFKRYGDMVEDDVVGGVRLGDMAETDPMPGTGKTVGELTEDDLVNTTAYQQRTKHASSFNMRPKH